jgi:hypothetical protein
MGPIQLDSLAEGTEGMDRDNGMCSGPQASGSACTHRRLPDS